MLSINGGFLKNKPYVSTVLSEMPFSAMCKRREVVLGERVEWGGHIFSTQGCSRAVDMA